MLWLQSRDKYNCLAIYNLKDKTLKKYSRIDLGDKLPKTNGSFSEVKEGILMLYRYEGNIFFRIYDQEFILDNKTEVSVSGPRIKRLLQVIREGKVIFKTYYTPIGIGVINGDLTPFVEEEHFDFGLFVSNISKDPKRKGVFLGEA